MELPLRVDQRELPYQTRRERNTDEQAQARFLHHGGARHDGETAARDDHALQGLGAAELHHRLQ